MDRRRGNNNDHQPLSFFKELDDDLLTLSLSPPTRHIYTPPPPSPPSVVLPPLLPPPSVLPLPPTLQNSLSQPPPPPTQPTFPFFFSSSTVFPSNTTLLPGSSTSLSIEADPSTSTNLITILEPSPSRNLSNRPAARGMIIETIPIPYPWATNRRATVHNIEHLVSIGIRTISGQIQCRRCERSYEIEYDLESKFSEVATFIAANRSMMHDRAPRGWTSPVLPTCTCNDCEQENSLKPIIADKKKNINWLFLLLGQMIGCCTLEQLKYFCKHTKNHRTGAKDRVLYLTYLTLCRQLYPIGPFDL